MDFESNYADAINVAMQEHINQMLFYGAFLAQAGVSLSDVSLNPSDMKYVRQGYAEQLAAFPNG